MGYELSTDSGDPDTENKEGKKEIKEFTVTTPRKTYAVPSLIYSYKVHRTFISPHPVLDKQTPPPDPAC